MQKGQAALIALLILTVATTVGLSLVARSTTDISITRNLEESARAFSAAEAGVEDALRTGATVSGPQEGKFSAQYNATVTPKIITSNAPYVFPSKTVKENTETVWLVGHNLDGTPNLADPNRYKQNTITLCWSDETPTPAVVVSFLYIANADGTYRIAKAVYDSSGQVQGASPPDASGNGCGAGTGTTFRKSIAFNTLSITPASDILIAMRIRPVFSGAQIAVTPLQDLPSQGNQIESTGNTLSGVTRKIVVFQQYKSASSLFDAAVFSKTDF